MSTTKIGIQFEKYVQSLLKKQGIKARRNIMYHKGKRKRQIDLDYVTGILFRTHTIIECKYVRPGNSAKFYDSYIQLGEAMLFTGADEGILVTPASISKRKQKESKYRIKIYDASWFRKHAKTDSRSLDKIIRSTTYDKNKDHEFVHRYL